MAAGVFADERIELIEGVLVTMSPNDPEHANSVQVLTQILILGLAGRAVVQDSATGHRRARVRARA